MNHAIGHRIVGLALVVAGLCAPLASAHAAIIAVPCKPAMVLDEPIARAAQRFAIPDTLIRAVIVVESGGVVYAVSPKGAMGLMQLMPGTWADLRRRYDLGGDPFDPCDNIFAGTAYLRELLDRYGDPGFLAAYNAGPGRYKAYLAGRPLPAETVAYVARLSGRLMDGGASAKRRTLPDPEAWRGGELFVRSPLTEVDEPARSGGSSSSEPQTKPDSRPSEAARDTVFVRRTGVPK
ncbi:MULTISPECIES: lytic transglycosylase domain-containing protein [unclassified Sphingomonas]|jgi:soluble lytic murein transglycosylase-like protein|uniref:lytic transglycosylase domain-containing protein n=1 Tax=Sphingomonas TaxID=13687 RepID=UPI000A5421C5|nr:MULTISPECIES: lytic transglycosylase domain-containing protein [unclassified Sphingomonas]MBX3565924.1 lytic transglycosylase domain-containing protein [Sphingomonas sp.]